MGNVIIHIKDKWSESKTFDPIELRVFHRYVIIKYWVREAKTTDLADDLIDFASDSGLSACKVEASTGPMTHEHDAYHESAAGILFGGALESGMRYVFTMKCVDPYAGDQLLLPTWHRICDHFRYVSYNHDHFRYVSERLTRFQLALVNLDYKVGYPVSGSL
eukprot:890978_1